MKRLLSATTITALGALCASAADVLFYGSSTAEGAYEWSSTTKNQPWANGTMATTSDEAVWKGIDGKTSAPGYVIFDGTREIGAIKVSGSGGIGSDLHLIFSEEKNSVLNFSKGTSFFNLNTYYADLYFDGTGEVNFTNATTSYIALTTTNATSQKAKVVFDTGIKFNNASAFSGKGQGSENSQLLFKGETNFNSYMMLSNIKFSLDGSTKKFVGGDIAAEGDSIVEFTNGANVQTYGGYKGRGASVINIDSASSYTLNNANFFYVGTANEHSATANIWGTVNAATSTLKGTGAATFNLKEGGKATFKTVSFSDGASNMKMNIDGAMNVSGQFSTDSNNDMVVGKTGTLAVDGLFLIAGNLTTAAGRISTTFNSTGNELNGNIKMNEFGGFRVNADNKWNSSVLLRGGRTQIAVGNDATFEINSLLSISSVSGKSSTITLDDGALLIVGNIKGSATVGSEVYVGFGELGDGISNSLDIVGFEEKSVLFRAIGTDEENAKFLSKVLIDGAKNDALRFSELDSVAGGYWLTTVPEPAEWAAIFGAIALGLAVYRRRK